MHRLLPLLFSRVAAGYVVESMPSGVLDEQDPARFCARAYATARGTSIEQRCNSSDETDAASITTTQLAHTIAANNATVCDLLFRNASLLKIVHALLRQRAAAGSTEPQTGDKRKSSSSGRSGRKHCQKSLPRSTMPLIAPVSCVLSNIGHELRFRCDL